MDIILKSEKYGDVTVIVDDEDVSLLEKYHWNVTNTKVGLYVRGYAYPRKSGMVLMHRVIMGNPSNEFVIDHINHNTLDNRKSNLRICTFAQNSWNRSRKSKGVYRMKNGWMVIIRNNGERKYMGYFNSELEAKDVYEKATKELRGNYLNEFYNTFERGANVPKRGEK